MGLAVLFSLLGVITGTVAYFRAKEARANTLLALLGIVFNAAFALCDLLIIGFFFMLYGALGA